MLEAGRRLQGQAVDQVDIDAAISARARMVEETRGLIKRLDAVDRCLHIGRQVLHAKRDAVEAKIGKGVEVFVGRHPRIGLDGKLGAGQRREVAEQVPQQAIELLGRVIRGRAPAEMELREVPPVRQPCREEFDLAAQQLEIRLRHVLALRDDRVTAAEEAPFLAERQVRVEGERGIAERVRRVEALEIILMRDAVVELHRRRVARVTRARPVVARQEAGRNRAFDGTPGGARGRRGKRRHAMCSVCTVSINACTLSMGASGVMPWPRFTM